MSLYLLGTALLAVMFFLMSLKSIHGSSHKHVERSFEHWWWWSRYPLMVAFIMFTYGTVVRLFFARSAACSV